MPICGIVRLVSVEWDLIKVLKILSLFEVGPCCCGKLHRRICIHKMVTRVQSIF